MKHCDPYDLAEGFRPPYSATPPRQRTARNPRKARVIRNAPPRPSDPVKGRNQSAEAAATFRAFIESLEWGRLSEGEAELIVRTYRNARPGLRNLIRRELDNLARAKQRRHDKTFHVVAGLLEVLSEAA